MSHAGGGRTARLERRRLPHPLRERLRTPVQRARAAVRSPLLHGAQLAREGVRGVVRRHRGRRGPHGGRRRDGGPAPRAAAERRVRRRGAGPAAHAAPAVRNAAARHDVSRRVRRALLDPPPTLPLRPSTFERREKHVPYVRVRCSVDQWTRPQEKDIASAPVCIPPEGQRGHAPNSKTPTRGDNRIACRW